MKNFSEATVIKPTLKLDISVLLVGIGDCDCTLTVNGKILCEGQLNGSVEFKTQVGLIDPINITIAIHNRQHPQAVMISGIYIDNKEIMPLYLNHSTPPTNYLDFTGVWALTIPNFYPWYHAITGQGWVV